MPDILSQGGGLLLGSRSRRLAVIVLALAVLGVLLARYHPGHRAGPVRQPAAARSPAQADPPASAPGVLPAIPDGVPGPTAPWPRGFRLPTAGARPGWFYPAGSRAEQVGGLPAAREGYQFTRAGGGWAIQAAGTGLPGCRSCAVPPRAVYFLADHGRSATQAGTASYVAPAATPGTLWLTSFPAGSAAATAAGQATEVTAAGAVLTPAVRLPRGYLIDRGTDRGLVLSPVTGLGGAPELLWNAVPQSGRELTGLIAASAGEVAWARRCAPRCRVAVLHLASGRVTVVTLPPGSSAAGGAFSPDGRYLALQVSLRSGGDDGALAMQLEVASAASGRLARVPGTWASSDALAGFGWPSGGDTLIAELSFTSTFELAAWHPGVSRPAVASVRAGRDRASLVVG